MSSAETVQLNIKANLDMTQVKGGINSIQSQLSKLSLPKNMENSFNKVIQKTKSDITQLEALLSKGLTSKANVTSFNKLTNNVNSGYSKILTMINQLNGQKVTMKVDTAQIEKLQQKLQETQQKYQNFLNGIATGSNSNTFGNMLSSIEKVSSSSKTLKSNLEGVRSAIRAGDFEQAEAALSKFVNDLARLGTQNKGKIAGIVGAEELAKEIDLIKGKLSTAQNTNFKSEVFAKLKTELEALISSANVFEQEMTESATAINKIQSGNLEKVKTTLQDMASGAEKASAATQKATAAAQQSVMYQYDKQMQVNDLRMQVQYFFGLQNMIRLFRKGVQDAISTVKELDAAMTATAVVTPYTVGDMWKTLPEYTKYAKELGTTIADMYNATTLYYQQGLDTEHAMGTAKETLKMARIAGIEGAEATDLMTAALRGFRMESNEVNASHVNDVYSALAAHSASNTYEIGTAMSKVASLAASANMDLETTSTFLAQIIETTREAPETAGTALKTIIARFGEVKKLAKEGVFTGTDEEGEAIDINKVDTALKTAGISLQDFINGNEGLDQVFLRLAERWNTLSVAQQRYIATQAAGARMQARFIAMMQDYGRTQELLDIATNAEGAGEEQFSKTTESLEYKLNQLKDSYHSFIMGIANAGAIKTVVSLLTKGFDLANKAIQKVSSAVDHLSSGLGSAVKAALSLGTAFAALKIGGKLLNGGVNILGGFMLGKGAMTAGKTASTGGVLGSIAGARANAITAPICSKLDTLIAVTKLGNKNLSNFAVAKDQGISLVGRNFLSARSEINSLMKGGTATIGNVASKMSGYDLRSQAAIYNSSPGTAQAIRNNYLKSIKGLKLDDNGLFAKNFVRSQEQAFKSGKVSFDTYTKTAAIAANKSFTKFMPQVEENASKLIQAGINEDAAYQAAAKEAVNLRATELASQDPHYRLFKNYMSEDAREKWEAKFQGKAQKEAEQANNTSVKTSGIQNIANTVSSAGAGISSAGMALNQFSMQLSSMGADKAAAALSGLGSAFTTVGMAASSAGSLVTAFSNPVGIAIGVIAGLAGAAFMAYKAYQSHIKNIRKEGKQVTKDYEKNVVKQRESLSELSDSYLEYEQLRKGVDKKGNNVSLTEDQYQKYQDYTDKLIKMNSSLRQGVNEAGKAYISQSTDIKKALNDEAKEIKKSEDEYLNNANGQKVLDQISTYKRITKAFNAKDINGNRKDAVDKYNNPRYNTLGQSKLQNAGKFTKDAAEIKSALDSLELSGKQLKELHLDDINWKNIDAFDAKKIYDAKDAISDYVDTAKEGLFTDEKKNKISESLNNLITDYDDATKAASDMTNWLENYLSAAGKDGASIEKIFTDKLTAKQLSGKASDNLIDLGKEQASALVGGFREGLEQIVLQGQAEGWKDVGQYTKSAENFSDLLIDLSSTATSQGSLYADALKNIANEQEKFDNALLDGNKTLEKATDDYQSNIEKQLGSLEGLAQYYDELEASGVSGAGVIAENIRQGMDEAIEYTTNGRDRIAAALNDLSGSFESANAAIENYSEATKDLKDYYTVAEGLKSITEDIGWDSEKKAFTGKDAEGFGSKKFWLGAKELVDEKVLNKGTTAVKKQIAEIIPTLEEGEAGFGHFLNFLEKHKDKVTDFMKVDNEGNFDFLGISDENISKMADQLGVADTYLAAMIDKSRQFMKWKTNDPKKVAKALMSSEGIIHGTVTNKKGEEKQAYFANYDNLVAEARGAGLGEHEIATYLKGLEQNGIRVTNFDKLENGDKKERTAEVNKFKDLFESQSKEDHKLTKEDFKNTITKGKFFDEEKLKNAVAPLAQSGDYTLEEGVKALQATGLASKNLSEKEAAAISAAWEEATAAPDVKALSESNSHLANIESYASFIAGNFGQISQDIISSLDEKESKIRGEKGEYDTKYQKGGILGQDTKGNNLTYKGKKSLLKEVESERAEIQADYDAAERAFETAVTNSDKQKAKKQMDRASSLLSSLDYYESHGLAGTKTAEAIYGKKNGEKFNFTNFLQEDWEGLGKLDGILAKIDPKNLDYKTLKDSVNSVDLSGMARGSILGQYAWNNLDKQERGLLKEQKIDYSELGKAFQANDVDSFLEQIKRGGTGKLFDVNELDVGKEKFGQISALIGQIRDQYAEMQGLNFADADYWKLSEGMGTLDNIDAQAQEILSKYGGTEGFAAHLDFIADDTQALQAIQSIEDESTRIKVLDSIINITSDNGMSPEERAAALKQELTGLLGDSGQAQLIVDAILNTDEADGKVEELTGEKHETEVEVKADTQQAEADINGVTSQEYPVTLNPTVGGITNVLSPGAMGPSTTGSMPNTTIPVTAEVTDTTPPKEEVTVEGEAKVEKVSKSGKVSGEPVKVDAQATVKSVSKKDNLKDTKVSAKAEVSGTGKVKKLTSAINDVPKETSVDVTAHAHGKDSIDKLATSINNVQGKDVDVTVHKKVKDETGGGAGGLGKYTPTGWGSLAVGRKRSDSSFKGGPTLTGEEGYEVAWSPKSGKSMILGTDGPQMVDLPKDIVVWTHAESKKILKSNRATPLNSLSTGTNQRTIKKGLTPSLTGERGPEMVWYPKEHQAEILGVGGPQYVPNLPKDAVIWDAKQTADIIKRKSIPIDSHDYTGKVKGKDIKGYTGNNNNNNNKNKNPIIIKTDDKDKTPSKKLTQPIGKISKIEVDIYNLTKKIEQTSHKVEKNSEEIKNKLSDTIDFSYSQIRGLVNTQTKEINRLISQNKDLSTNYTKQLKSLDAGTGKYKNYQVTYNKKTKQKTGSGKKKKTKVVTKSTKKKINLGNYIYQDGIGAYQVDYNKINAIAKSSKKGGKNLAKAILEAAKKEIDDLSSKQLSADKAKTDAENKLKDLQKELKETLYAWENELTKIKDLETQISLNESFKSVVDNLQDLITKMADPSSMNSLKKSAEEYQRAIKASIEATRDQISTQRELRDAYIAELKDDLTLRDEISAYTEAKKNSKGTSEDVAYVQQKKDELDAARVGKRLLSTESDEYGRIQVHFDWKTLQSEKEKGNVSTTEYEAVKKYYEKIVEDVEKINDTNSNLVSSIASLYDMRNEQYQTMSDYTQKLREGMEEEEQKTIDNLKDLNSAIQNAFKDLIDKVKKELDKQRKAEQNKKTEDEISDKMNRLAMLRADTAGSNAAEIAQLEKEIADSTSSYEDNLEDQLLDRLQDQADEAAEQRERQIELMSAQLNYSKSAGLYLAKAENLTQKIADGTAKGEDMKLAQLYYLGSDKLLDKWGKIIASQDFASETVKVKSFNNNIETINNNIASLLEEAKKIANEILTEDKEVESKNLQQTQSYIKANKGSVDAKSALNKLMREGGMTREDALKWLRTDGKYTAKDFHDSGIDLASAKKAGFSYKDLYQKGGYTAKDFKSAGVSAKTAHDAGISYKDLKEGKYTAKDFHDSGISAKGAKTAGFTIPQLKKGGYTATDLSDVFKRKELAKYYNNAEIGQIDSGTKKKTTLDTNGKKKGGKIKQGYVSSTGATIAAKKGGAVYTQKYNSDTQSGYGKTTKTSFKNFTAKFVKQNQIPAGQELLYQLNKHKVGSKIHKKWKDLIAASTYSKLKSGSKVAYKNSKGNKTYGTIVGSGNIYYGTKKGVKMWNPTSGKISMKDKYVSKKKSYASFLKQAKKNSGISREYADVLLKNGFKKNQLRGVKKFATGGYADFTGPAWMDGTPSKPELVLNATDTQNFLALKDVLSEAAKRGVFNHEESATTGDINLDININVDKIDSDYDVDKVAARVKKIIINEAKNRNVTVTGRLR